MYMRYSTPLFNNVPTHVTVDFACVLRAGSTVTVTCDMCKETKSVRYHCSVTIFISAL